MGMRALVERGSDAGEETGGWDFSKERIILVDVRPSTIGIW